MNIQNFRIPNIFSSSSIIAIFIVLISFQFVYIEGLGVSVIKVALMALAPLIFIVKTPQINKAFIWGSLYWLSCVMCAYFAGNVRWSTLIYLGLFIAAFVMFYSLLRRHEVSLIFFTKFIKILIYLLFTILLLQQLCILIGIRNLPFINLVNQEFLAIDKLPLLFNEPSHAARIISVLMLAYLRCTEIEYKRKPIITEMFNKNNIYVTLAYLYMIATMGSGTGFICLGILLIYFINSKSIGYIIPIIIGLVALNSTIEIEQLNRAKHAAQMATASNTEELLNTDSSAATRILPLKNLFTKTDFSTKEAWFGNGTTSKSDKRWWVTVATEDTIGVVEQYGVLSLLFSLFLVYTCIIKKFFSIETIFFLLIFGLSLSNIAYIWAAMMIFAAVRYFQEQQEDGTLEFAEEELDEDLEDRLIAGKESAD